MDLSNKLLCKNRIGPHGMSCRQCNPYTKKCKSKHGKNILTKIRRAKLKHYDNLYFSEKKLSDNGRHERFPDSYILHKSEMLETIS